MVRIYIQSQKGYFKKGGGKKKVDEPPPPPPPKENLQQSFLSQISQGKSQVFELDEE